MTSAHFGQETSFRTQRALVRAAILAGCVLAGAVLHLNFMGSATARPPTQVTADFVECRTFVIRDGTNRARMQITCSGSIPTITLLDSDGKPSGGLRLRAIGEQVTLELVDSKGCKTWATPCPKADKQSRKTSDSKNKK